MLVVLCERERCFRAPRLNVNAETRCLMFWLAFI